MNETVATYISYTSHSYTYMHIKIKFAICEWQSIIFSVNEFPEHGTNILLIKNF